MKGFFSQADLTIWPQVTLVFFIIVFVFITLRVLRPSAKDDYIEASRMPLDENENLRSKNYDKV